MPTLNASQIAAYARAAGFSGQELTVAVAVALGESSGRTTVVNPIGCVGLWQINQPVHVQSHPTWSKEWLKNPANNARAAYTLSNGGRNWQPWEAYTNGDYKKHLSAAKRATGIGVGADFSVPFGPFGDSDPESPGIDVPVPGGELMPGLGDVGSALKAMAIATARATAWISNSDNWLRAVQVVLGGALVVGGLVVVARPFIKPVADKAIKVGKAAAARTPAGRAAAAGGQDLFGGGKTGGPPKAEKPAKKAAPAKKAESAKKAAPAKKAQVSGNRGAGPAESSGTAKKATPDPREALRR